MSPSCEAQHDNGMQRSGERGSRTSRHVTVLKAQDWPGSRGAVSTSLDVELTERCNNACGHCCIALPSRQHLASGMESSTEQWCEILEAAAGVGILSVRFTGGEPLLRPDFPDIYLKARTLGLKVTIATNARLFTPEIADLLTRVPPLESVDISVYGATAPSYDAVAGAKGAYDEFRRGVGLLAERGVAFVLTPVVLPTNVAEIEALEGLVAVTMGTEPSASSVTLLDLRGRWDSSRKNAVISSLRFPPRDVVSLLSRRGDAFREEMAAWVDGLGRPRGESLFPCGAGQRGCVDAYGKLQMCLLLRHPESTYDLRTGSLQEALTETFPRFRERRATNPAYLERCARCFLGGLCEQCPAKSWAEHGTLDTPVEYLCEVAHALARHLGLLGEGELAWETKDWPERVEAFAGDVQTSVGSGRG